MGVFNGVIDSINEQDFSQKFNTPGIKKVAFDKVTLEEDFSDDYGNSFEAYLTILFKEFNELGLDDFVPAFTKLEFKLKSSNDEKEVKNFILNMSNTLACFFDGKPLEATKFIKANQDSFVKLQKAISGLFTKPFYFVKIRRGVISTSGRIFYGINIRANHPCLAIDESKIHYSDERDNDRLPENNDKGYVKAEMGGDINSDKFPFEAGF
jgi:hypothetical protein